MTKPRAAEDDNPPRRRPTSADVARLAGTSRATVSYVLNSAPGVTISEGTRERVLAAAKELNYVPSLAAQSLAAGTSKVLLLMLPDAPLTSFIVALIHSLQRACRPAGIVLTVYFAGPDETDPEKLGMATMAQTLLALHPLSDSERETFDRMGIRTLAPEDVNDGAAGDLVNQTLAWAGRRQVAWLADRGHRQLAYVALADPRRDPFSAPRQAGVLRACHELGLPHPVIREVPTGLVSAEVVAELIDLGVTAVAAYNDDVALALRTVAGQLGAEAQIEFVGGDDQPFAALLDPPLSSVRINTDAIATAVIEKVLTGSTGADPSALVQVIDRSGVAR